MSRLARKGSLFQLQFIELLEFDVLCEGFLRQLALEPGVNRGVLEPVREGLMALARECGCDQLEEIWEDSRTD